MNGFRVLYNQSGQNATDFTPPDVLLALCYRVLRKYLNLIVVIYPCFDISKFTYLCKKQ
jgi:hypothetical protein